MLIYCRWWKESLNSDGHQYQQNEQSLIILTEQTEHKNTTTCDVWNSGPGLEQAHKCGCAKLVLGRNISRWMQQLINQLTKHDHIIISLVFHMWCLKQNQAN